MANSFWEFLDDRVKGVEKNIPWFVNDKIKANQFFLDEGIPTPKINNIFDSVEDVDLNQLPDEFCIKPTVMHSARGVLPLVRVASDRFFDRLRKRVISGAAIKHELELAYEQCSFKGSFKILVEQSLGYHRNDFLIPYDYKFYTFKTGVGLVVKIDRNSGMNYLGFFDDSFAPLNYADVICNSLDGVPALYCSGEKPKFSQEMLSCAKKVVEILDTPFASVDMYSTSDGFYVGEVTPAPGAPYYKKMFELNASFDRKLGDMWAQSLTKK